MNLSAYDFDGTLTNRDSLLEFIRFVFGPWRFFAGLALFIPYILLMKAGAMSNSDVKQRLFSHFFKGMETARFNTLARDFAWAKSSILRPAGVSSVEQAVERGDSVVVISASIVNWVEPFFERFGDKVKIIGTEIESADGRLTGGFATPNCYGAEKPRRLAALFPAGSYNRLVAYGDSRGDRELLHMADERHYKPFRDPKS